MSKLLNNSREIIARLTSRSVSPLSIWFALEMQVKLDSNRRKSGWDLMQPDEILTRIKDEVKELEDAIESGVKIDMVQEAVDVANFCSFLAHNMQYEIDNP